jgi:hypothetical protein
MIGTVVQPLPLPNYIIHVGVARGGHLKYRYYGTQEHQKYLYVKLGGNALCFWLFPQLTAACKAVSVWLNVKFFMLWRLCRRLHVVCDVFDVVVAVQAAPRCM